MPAEHMIPGFFGKIPATGDFVVRRLDRTFVRFWDRLAARHLAKLIETGLWPSQLGLRFLLQAGRHGPMVGVTVPSSDRVGRRFPLAAAASCAEAGPDMVARTTLWLSGVEKILITARDESMDADRLADMLAGLPFPSLSPSKAGVLEGLLLWIDGAPPVVVDPEAPQDALEELFATAREAD
jgi:type VI secretion system protein ImpM